jgi:phosphoglycolate phosphatase
MGVGLLDLDGTLTDSKVGITRSVQYALRRARVDVADLETLTPYIGPPLQDSFVALAGFSQADAIRAVASYREYFAETGIFENAVYPGIPECLEALQAQGWRLAVAMSKPTVFAERILDHFSLLTHFQAVVGAGLDGGRRHKHEVIAAALSDLGVAADERCIMVGDREHDVIGAKTVGLLSVGVTWGYGSVQELSEAGADVLVHAVADLPEAMERLGRRRLT